MDLFQNKYRIPSARAQWWDYGNSGRYFITICTQDRRHFFGEIKNKIMCLSEIGRLAYHYWMEIPHHFDYVILDEFVVMPNHIHGIIIINKNDDNDCNDKSPGRKRFRNPGKKNVSSVIGAYTSIVSKKSHLILSEFDWQPRFHDHIIRNEGEYYRIKNYIANNSKNWNEDRFNG